MEVMAAVVGMAEVEVGEEGMEGVREWPDESRHRTQDSTGCIYGTEATTSSINQLSQWRKIDIL